VVAGAQAQQSAAGAPPLSITTDSLPSAERRREYHAELRASGGTPPYRWSISAGKLPEGLELDPSSGVISGVPSERGDFRVTVAVTDSGEPAQRVERELIIASAETLSLEWSTYPQVAADQINGSVKVENGSKDNFDQTVIILAVNEYGKAFTLGYRHFVLKTNSDKVEIPFGSTLPRGSYVVHADAIAEVESKGAIYRNRLETPQPLVVAVP
jgi:hypothetical protein